MAEKTGLSQTAVVRIWRAFGLQPYPVWYSTWSVEADFLICSFTRAGTGTWPCTTTVGLSIAHGFAINS